MRKGEKMESNLEYLAVPLPEDVLKLKYFGDMERLQRVLAMKLSDPALALPLRRRLEYERLIMSKWEREYPFTQEEALEAAGRTFRDFSAEELEGLRDADAVEWTYIGGQVRYKNNFIYNLIATRRAYRDRTLDEGYRTSHRAVSDTLNAAVAHMKAHGGMKCRMHMHFSAAIEQEEARRGQKVVCQLPLPVEYAQVKNFRLLSVSHPDALIAPPDFPARTIRFEAVPDRPFEVAFSYEMHAPYRQLEPSRVSAQQPHFLTEEMPPHIVFTPLVRMMTAQIVGDEKNPLLKARKIYDYITTQNTYSFMRAYWTLPNIPEYFLTGRKGDCGVQALTFITLCRCAGIPACWQSGLEVNPLEEVGCHDWAMFYVAPYGWLYADPSFGGSAYRDGEMERWHFYFGSIDPYRMPAASQFQQTFYQPMKHARHDPYDNQTCEAEYEDAPVLRNRLTLTQEALRIEVLP